MNEAIVEIVNVTRAHAWLPWAVQYFFLIGLSLGGFLLSLPAFAARREDWLPLGRLALLVAVTCGVVAPVALLADLHQPNRFWHFYVYPQPGSWMSWGSWFIPAYVGLLLLYALAALRRHPAVRMLGGLTLFAAALVALYTGAEVAIVKARPLWNTPLLPVQFLATAVVGACGAVLVLNRLLNRGNHAVEVRANQVLALFLGVVMVLGGLWLVLGAAGLSDTHARALASVSGFAQWQVTALWAALAVMVPFVLALRWPAGSGWVTGLIALHAAWMFRWTVFMGGQSVPKVGAGLYDYILPLGPEGLLGILGSFGLCVFVLIALTSLVPWRAAGLPDEPARPTLSAKEN